MQRSYQCVRCHRALDLTTLRAITPVAPGKLQFDYDCECSVKTIAVNFEYVPIAMKAIFGEYQPQFPWRSPFRPLPRDEIDREVKHARWELEQIESADEMLEWIDRFPSPLGLDA